jgi:hypothetical protein
MAIYYYPNPGVQPSTALTQYLVGDYFVTQNGEVSNLKKGTLKNTWTRVTSSPLPPTATPSLVSSTLVTTKQLDVGKTVNFDVGSVYGGSAVATSYTAAGTFVGLNYTISPALPAGLTLGKVFSVITSGPNLYNNILFSISGSPTSATPLTSYTITVTDSTGLSATLSFSLETKSAISVLVLTQAVPVKKETVAVAEVGFTPVTATGGSGALTFSVSPTLPTGFTMDSVSGKITGTGTAASPVSTYTVTVTDSSSPAQSKTETFSFSVESVPLVVTTVVPTKVLQQNIAATKFTPVTAKGGTGTLTFTVSPSLPAGLTFSTIGEITGTSTSPSVSTLYTVTVKDGGAVPLTGTSTFTLTVDPLVALTTTQVIPTTTLTKNILSKSFTPVTAAGGFGTLTYAISPALPAGLVFSTTSGAISGTPTASSSATTYTVTVTDQASQTSNKTFSLSVAASALNVSLDIATKIITSNVAVVAFTPVSANGGTGTITFSISPTLYPLLSFSTTNGEISGTANAVHGNTPYTITATDQTPTSINKTFYLTINAPPPLVTTTVIPSQNVSQNEVSTPFSPVTATGGYGKLSWFTTPTLPTGLLMNGASGSISGTPALFAAANNYVVTVQDEANQISNSTFSLTIDSPTLLVKQAIPTKSIFKDVVANEFAPVTATGGSGVYTFTISRPLPTGLSLDANTGKITGTPTVVDGPTTYTITVRDTSSQTGFKTFALTVDLPPALTTTTVIPTKTIIRLIDDKSFIPVTASGGYGTLTFSVTPTLPTGLAFDKNNGTISGIASIKTANTLYIVTAMDQLSQNSNSSFYLTSISQPLLANNTTTGNTQIYQYLVMTPITPVKATGGSAPYTYSVSPTLPQYIELNSNNGLVTGNAVTTVANTTYTVTITDSEGVSNSNTFILGVTVPPALIANTVVPSVNVTTSLAVSSVIPVTANGGYQPLTYSIGPSLPTGLKLDANTGAITGITTTLSPNTLYTITATDILLYSTSSTFYLTASAPALYADVKVPTKTLVKYKLASPFIPVSANGGFDPITYSITPSLPSYLTFSTSTGEITGTSDSNTANILYTVDISDSANQKAQSTFYMTVDDVLPIPLEAVLQVSNVDIYQGDITNVVPVTGVGGTTPYKYSISPTALPSGLVFDTITGSINGTASVTANASNYVITVSDQVPQSKSQTVTLVVKTAPADVIDRVARRIANSKASLAFYKIVANGNAITATSNADTVYINANVANGIIIVSNTTSKTINLSLSRILSNAGTYGANNQIPIITIGTDGRISNVSTANIDTTTANAAFAKANLAYDLANSAYGQANTANSLANLAYSIANSGSSTANAGSTLAQAAFNAANTKFSSSGGTISGNVTIQKDLSVLGNVNFIGNVTSVTVSGNSGQFFGYTANGFNALYAGIPVGYLVEPQTVQQLTANYDGYAGLNMQNINSGANASFDVFITADNGSATDGYLDLGLASSNYNYVGEDFDLIQKNDGYLFTHGNTTTRGGNTIIGSYHNDVVISANGMGKSSEIIRFSDGANGKSITVTGNLTSTGSIILNGVNIGSQLNSAFSQANVVPTLQLVTEQGASTFIPVRILNNSVSTGITTGALLVSGGIGSRGQISSNSLFVVGQANIGSTLFAGGDLVMANNTTFRPAGGNTTDSPIKLTAGTLKTNPINGDFEFDGGQLYITTGANKRNPVATSDKVPFGTLLKPVQAVVTGNTSVANVANNIMHLSEYDGVILQINDRVLFTGQSNPIDNGIYVFQGEGQYYIRSSDMNINSNTVGGTMIVVSDGIEYQESVWTLKSLDPILVTSDPLLFDRVISRDSISISNLSNNVGVLTKTQNGSIIQRSITANAQAGLFVTNQTGVNGNPQIDISVIPVNRGGTGVNNTADLLDALGVAGAGVNTNITELAGLTKALRVAYGGTGAYDGSKSGSPGISDSQAAYYGRLRAKRNLLFKPNQYGVTSSGTYSDQLSWPSQNSATVYTEGFGTDYVLSLKMPDSPIGSTYAGNGDFIDFKSPYPTMINKNGQKLTVVETYNDVLNYWTRQAQWRAVIDVGFDYANNRYDTTNVGMTLVMNSAGQIQWDTVGGMGTVIGVRGEATDSDITVINYNTAGNSIGYITSNGRINIALNTITHSKLPVIQMNKGGTGNPSMGVGYLRSNGTIVTSNIHIPGNTISGNLLLSNMNVQHGGTGANNRIDAMINLLPSYVDNNGKALLINAAASDVEWVSVSGVGTVTSVGINVPNDGSIIIGNSPIIAAGNITMKLGVVPTGNGGTGNNVLTPGYVYSTGNTTAMTSNIHIPGSVVSGNILGAASGLTTGVVLPLRNGGTGGGGSLDDDVNRRIAKASLLKLNSESPNHRDVLTYWNPPASGTQDKITWQPLWPTPNTSSSNAVFANTLGINYTNGPTNRYLLAPFLRYNPANPFTGTEDISLSWEYPYPSPNGISNTVLTHTGNNELAWTATSQGIVRTVLSSSFVVTTANLGQTVFINTPDNGLAIANGGTGGNTRVSAINNLLPPQTNEKNGWVLFTDGGNAYWQSVPGTGTVTSVGLEFDPGEPFSVSGTPITAAGTFNLKLDTVPISKGGTGSTTIGGARTNLGAAKSGVNSDITRLTGLVTPLAVSQGGTGTNTLTGYIKGNGTGAFTAVASIPAEDLGIGTLGMQNADAVNIIGGAISNVTLKHVTVGNNMLGMSTVSYSIIRDSVLTSNVIVTLDSATITGNTVLSGNVVIQSDLSVTGDITTTSNLHANYIQSDNDITANGNLFILGNSKTYGSANVGAITANNGIYLNPISWMSSNTYTTSGLSQVTVDQFSASNFRSAKYFIQITSGTKYQATELTMVHDDTNAYISQFGTVKNSVVLGTFDAAVIVGGILTLKFTPTFSSTVLKMHRTTIRK